MDLAAFRARHPAFARSGDELVNAVLAAAALEMDVSVWGDSFDEGHGLLTAHKLATAPEGMNARLQTEKGKSTYGDEYLNLVRTVSCGIRLL
jgi:hypothetical protein